MSLPVSVEKGPPPSQRRKSSPDNEQPSSSNSAQTDNSFFLNPAPTGPTKSQLKREKEEKRKAKRHNKRMVQKQMLDNMLAGNSKTDETKNSDATAIGCANRPKSGSASSCSSSAESDADVEDNLQDDTNTTTNSDKVTGSRAAPPYDSNGNRNGNQLASPAEGKPEKRDDSPENMDKDSLDEDENGN